MAQKHRTVHRARTDKPCTMCQRTIPRGTAALVTTTKSKDGEYVDEYVCWRCGNPYG